MNGESPRAGFAHVAKQLHLLRSVTDESTVVKGDGLWFQKKVLSQSQAYLHCYSLGQTRTEQSEVYARLYLPFLLYSIAAAKYLR